MALNNTNEIGRYVFEDAELLKNALTHSSYTNELVTSKRDSGETNNERLEFLGDAVLELTISEYIYKTYPELTEGEMTKLRANVVCEATLSEAARTLNVGSLMRVGRGEENTGGRERGSILADCFEAVTGAVFIDGGFDAARSFIVKNLSQQIKKSRESFMNSDYKTRLQELVQRYSKDPLEYVVVSETGPAHDKTFAVRLTHENRVLAVGQGKSKKEAEQNCAGQALNRFESTTHDPKGPGPV